MSYFEDIGFDPFGDDERAHILGAWNRTVPLTQYLDQGIGLIH